MVESSSDVVVVVGSFAFAFAFQQHLIHKHTHTHFPLIFFGLRICRLLCLEHKLGITNPKHVRIINKQNRISTLQWKCDIDHTEWLKRVHKVHALKATLTFYLNFSLFATPFSLDKIIFAVS